MLIFLSVSRQAAIESEMEKAISSVFKESFHIDHIRSRHTFIGYFPGNRPASVCLDYNSFSEETCMEICEQIHLLYPKTPVFIYYQMDNLIPEKNYPGNVEFISYRFISELEEKFTHTFQKTKKSVISTPDSIFFSLKESGEYFKQLTNPEKIFFLRQKYMGYYSKYQFFVCFISEYESVNTDSFYLLHKIYRNILSYTEKCFAWQMKPHTLLVGFYEHEKNLSAFMNFRGLWIQNMKQNKIMEKIEEDVEIRMQTGCIHSGLHGFYKSYFEAAETSYVDKLYKRSNTFEDISSLNKHAVKPLRLVELERMIRNNLEYKNGDDLIYYIGLWFKECRKMGYTVENIQMDLLNLYASIKYVIFDMYMLREPRIKKGWEPYEIFRIETIDELEEWFYTWVCYTMNNIHNKHNIHHMRIHDALEFIENHLIEDISLESISSYFFLNPSYFSSMFKREMKETFISYVTRMKMQKAAELLKGERKVSEVSYLLGYDDTKHFRNLFKKHYGHTPSEYQSLYKEQESSDS